MAKMQIIGDPFKDLIARIDKAGGNIQKAADDALTKSAQLIQSNTNAAASPYASTGRKGYATGEMFRSIIKSTHPVWIGGSIAEVKVGFDLKAPGGYHSIFLMYGTPRMAKDTALFNAIKGAKTQKEVQEIQQQVLQKYLTLDGK